MTDYGEEQRNELEALESIYPDSFTVLSENPPSFTITVISEAGENDETVQTTLKFTYSEKYPDEAPLYEIFTQLNLENNDVADILKLLALQAEENLGIVDESLFQEMDDLELEEDDDDPDNNPADRESDLTD
uniref:RWD domain-containing protein 1 n=1 Tax=Bos indicus x Bos taurus TaxID=30522 RepID=A0A4W2BR90_BOBOX